MGSVPFPFHLPRPRLRIRLRRFAGTMLAAVAAGCTAVAPSPPSAPPGPQAARLKGPPMPLLLVVVVVDQMPSTVIERHGDRFRDGLARVLHGGYLTLAGRHRHGGTFTAAGHATLTTGTDPRHHGFVANRWWDRTERREVDVVEDGGVRVVGVDGGRPLSPHRLLRTGLADWWEARDPRAHTWSVGLKDRAVIALGGRHPDAAVWLDRKAGRFVTSTWYGPELPAFARGIDVEARARDLLGAAWDVLRGDRNAPVPDAVPAEADGRFVTFPHAVEDLLAWDETVVKAVRYTPMGNTLVADLAVAAVETGRLGADPVPDLLLVAFSSTDYVGHRFGPDSREIVDTYDRLDADLGRLLDTLDARVGRDRYLLAFASDHGVTRLPELAGGVRIDPGRLSQVAEAAARAHMRRTGRGRTLPPPEVVYRDGVFLSFDPRVPPDLRADVRGAVARALRALDAVADAFTADELAAPPPPERRFGEALARSFHPQRSPDVVVVPAAGSLVIDYPGTTHGTPYPWDQTVPIAFVGPGIDRVRTSDPFVTVDVAPTLARIFGVAVPDDLDGAARDLARGHGPRAGHAAPGVKTRPAAP